MTRFAASRQELIAVPRQKRKQSQSNFYHVMARGVGRQIIFEDDQDRKQFLRILRRELSKNGVTTHAWCLMSNHFHFLFNAPIDHIAATLKTSSSQYAIYFNKRHGRAGHLFQGRFCSEPIDSDEYLLTVVRYIHQNPVKAGFSKTCLYRWSSFQDYLGKEGFTETEYVLKMMGGKEPFVRFHENQTHADKCLDIEADEPQSSPILYGEALAAAKKALGAVSPYDVKTLPKHERNKMIIKLKETGLSVRQIERICGIGRNIIQRAK